MTSEEKTQKLDDLDMQISILTSQLTAPVSSVGDWKVIKCYEYSLAGLDSPYDFDALREERQAIRDQINALQEEMAEVRATETED